MSRSIEALAAELILAADKTGVRIDMDYAMTYIAARQALQAHPDDEAAKQTVLHLQMLMSPFGRFQLPEEDYEKHCLCHEQSIRNSTYERTEATCDK